MAGLCTNAETQDILVDSSKPHTGMLVLDMHMKSFVSSRGPSLLILYFCKRGKCWPVGHLATGWQGLPTLLFPNLRLFAEWYDTLYCDIGTLEMIVFTVHYRYICYRNWPRSEIVPAPAWRDDVDKEQSEAILAGLLRSPFRNRPLSCFSGIPRVRHRLQ